MGEKKNSLFIKIMIGFIPVLVCVIIFMIVFSSKNDNTPEDQSLFLADSKAESAPSSKTAAYKAVKEKQENKKREAQESKIMSNTAFYDVEDAPKIAQQQAPQTAVATSVAVSHDDASRTTTSPKRVQSSSHHIKSEQPASSESDENMTDLEKLEALQREAGIKPTTQSNKTTKETSTAQTAPAAPPTNPNGRSRGLSSGSQIHEDNLISAVIHDDQVITNGSKVKIRLSESIVVDGVNIPRNSFVAGIASFSKTRINIALSSIIVGNNIISFSRSVYDKDGMQGIYLPENYKSEATSEAGSDIINGSLNTISGSMGVLGAALSSGKNLMRKSTSRQTVTLKANYKIFIK